jgi:hypothetical protein
MGVRFTPSTEASMSSRPGETDQPTQAANSSIDATRRRFLVAGLVTAPVILTLSARPALAQTGGYLDNYASAKAGAVTTGDVAASQGPARFGVPRA